MLLLALPVFIAMKILITGGTGSLGRALVNYWHGEHELTVLSRNPHRQAEMSAIYSDVKFVLADVRDREAVFPACKGQNALIHAAALKIVSIGQEAPIEYADVNVGGTVVVAEAWREAHPGVKALALLISTDKAVSPLNFYGGGKQQAEGIARQADFSIVRYGNVVNSDGTFLRTWRRQVDAGKPIVIRYPEPTRFIIQMDDALAMVEDALVRDDPGMFVPRLSSLRAFSVWDVATALGCDYVRQPLTPGEKQHELLVAEGEGTEEASDLLDRVVLNRRDDTWRQYGSNRVKRLTGDEFLEAVGWYESKEK